MSQSRRRRKAPSLAAAVFGFVAFAALLAAAGAWYVVDRKLADFRQTALAHAVTIGARGVELDFARSLHEEWSSTRTIAEDLRRRGRSGVRTSLDLLVRDSSRVSWAGIAGLDGTVRVASGGLLVGQDVSQRPWFRRGLEGDFAGNSREARPVADLLPNEDGSPRWLLDLSTPIRNSAGRVTGVLGLYLDYGWAREHLQKTAEALELDVIVVDGEGAIILATEELDATTLALPSLRAAAAGASVTSVETWPDGTSYLTSVIPQIAHGDLPSLGWSMVVRIENDAIGGQPVSTALIVFLGGFGLLLAAMTLIFMELFIRPLHRIAESARAILRGEDVYPFASSSTSEAHIFTAAVARLQGHEVNRDTGD